MIAAHPDDENTAVLAYFARGRKVDTAYLSLTRGEGGQNLIGPEQGDRLGVIRTQELLDARRIDGAQQFFSRAIDFGFTKTADETLQKWGRDRILADIVWRIRLFRPDVIILRFSGTPRDGHGQHQTSAILGREAFGAAADPHRFPEQLTGGVEPWQAKRLLWNVFAFTREQEREAESMGGRIAVDPGAYDPVLGFSYGEIAGMSRSMHRSQAMGSPERKGSRKDYFVTVAGDAAKQDVFDDIDTTWARVPGAAPVAALFDQAAREFDAAHPEAIVPVLAKARPLLAALKGIWAGRKLHDLDEAIALCAGIAVDATAERADATPGSDAHLSATAIRRSSVPAELIGVTWTGTALAKPATVNGAALGDNVPWTQAAQCRIDPNEPYTQPYWLRAPADGDVYRIPSQDLVGLPENPPLLAGVFLLRVAGVEIELTRPVVNRYVDRVYGERWRPFVVAAPVAISMPEDAVVFPEAKPKRIEVGVRAVTAAQSGTVRLEAPAGWRVSPDSASFALKAAAEQTTLSFEVMPPAGASQASLVARATVAGRDVASEMATIDYPHIPAQTLFPPAPMT
jgi:LmbE family N-acetylglucosaminyl deacetylase